MTLRGQDARRAATLLEVLVVIAIVATLIAILLPAVFTVRMASYRIKCGNNLRQLGLALEQYHAQHGALPAGCTYEKGKHQQPHMSWHARLLPYCEQEALWHETLAAYQKEPFFRVMPPHTGLGVIIPLFVCPIDPVAGTVKNRGKFSVAFTSYLGVEGTDQYAKDGLLFVDSHVRKTDCADGTSHTIMVGERPPSHDRNLGWWYAGWGQEKDGSAEMVLGAREVAKHRSFKNCPADANRFEPGHLTDQCDALHFWSMHPGGAHFLMCDGSVHFLSYSADRALPALATRAGHEAVEVP